MFLLETRFYGIYEELPHNVIEDAIRAAPPHRKDCDDGNFVMNH